MKRIGFLSFGHWSDSYGSQVRTAADSLIQSLELAVAAEELGADGAYFRVHHFARQLGSPFPLLAAIGARTRTIEIGTAVIDMRYENPMYMAEDAGAADLISGGRLQLGISRGSPEQVIDGWRHFGYEPADGESDADLARRHADVFLEVIKGEGFAKPNPRPMFPNPPGLLRLEPHSEGLRDRIWWGAGSNATAQWAAARGMNLQSSTLKFDETGEPLHVQQRKQIEAYREAWKAAGHAREPRVSVSRSMFALVDDRDRAYFGRETRDQDQIGFIDANTRAIFGRSYAAEPDVLVKELAADEAIAVADTLLLTVPNTLGVDYNAHVIESILKYVAPGTRVARPQGTFRRPVGIHGDGRRARPEFRDLVAPDARSLVGVQDSRCQRSRSSIGGVRATDGGGGGRGRLENDLVRSGGDVDAVKAIAPESARLNASGRSTSVTSPSCSDGSAMSPHGLCAVPLSSGRLRQRFGTPESSPSTHLAAVTRARPAYRSRRPCRRA